MNKQDDGGAAFPRQFKRWDNDYQSWVTQDPDEGMTLRDYFATKATDADIESVMVFGEAFRDPCDRASARYRFADLMLRARTA